MSSKQRNKLLLKDKYSIINEIESGGKRDLIISKYKLKSSSHLSKIIKSKDKIKESYEKLSSKATKTVTYVRKSNYPDVEKALVLWLKQMRDKRISLSSNIISEKAQKLAEMMGYPNFRASNRYI